MSNPRSLARLISRLVTVLAVCAAAAALCGCGGGGGDGDSPAGGGGGSGSGSGGGGGDQGGGGTGGGGAAPGAVSGLAEFTPIVIPDSTGGLLSLDPGQLRVKRAVDLVFVTGNNVGDFNPFIGDVVDVRRDDIFALDYSAGRTRQLVSRRPSGTVIFPLLPIAADGRLFYLYPSFDGRQSTFIEEIDPQTGAPLSQSEVTTLAETCAGVAGGDLFFARRDDLLVVRDFAAQGVAEATRLADAAACGDALATLDGALVALTYPNRSVPDRASLEAWEVDTATGERLGTLAQVPADFLVDAENFRAPQVALASDGIYAIAWDAISIELWFVGYGRRPGDPVTEAASPAPELLGRIEMPFFADVIPGSGILSVEDIFSFAVQDGVLSLAVRLREEASDGTFFWGPLVVVDAYADAVDLISLGGRVLDSKVLVRAN